MTDLRENLGFIIYSISSAIAMIIGWMVQSGIIVAIVSVLIGAGISYFVTTKTQKRAWKREYAVKIAETVYGLVYRDLKWIIWFLENEPSEHELNFKHWGIIQEDHRYLMVDEVFRDKLDTFFERVRRYNDSVNELKTKILPSIINKEVERIFMKGTPADEIKLEVRYKDGTHIMSTSPKIIDCLISEIHPKDYAMRSNPEAVILEFLLLWGQVPASPMDVDKFDEFWESSLRRMKEDKTYNFVIEENGNLLEEARKMKKEIVKRIEEPWRI